MLFGIDLGGTKIEGAVINFGDKLEVLSRLRRPTEAEKGYESILLRIKEIVDLLIAETNIQPEKIGICTPGSMNPHTQTLKNSNTLCLNDKPIKQDLEKLLGVPVNIANDANCFAVAEATLGCVPDVLPNAETVFGVIMGTGVGGGVVVNKKVLNGKQGIGGEWGHIVLDDSGGMCYCGKVGCAEKVISGTALEAYYESISGKKLKLAQILLQRNEDEFAEKTIHRLIHFFGKGISYIINILDPDAIVLGGGVGNIDLLYTEGLEEVKKYIFNPHPEILLLKPKLGDSAGVFGAALL